MEEHGAPLSRARVAEADPVAREATDVIDLTTTNVLLGILAAVAVLQMIGMIAGAVFVSRAYRRGMERVEQIERNIEEKVNPAVVRAQSVIDRLDRLSERAEAGAEKLDRALAVTARGAEIALTAVNGRVHRTATLAAALAKGGRAALSAWRDSTTRRSSRPALYIAAPVTHNPHRTEEHHVSIRG
jgi:hypothetical protein